jgi:hypothetical protein
MDVSVTDEEMYLINVETDTKHFNELINRGGRPSHPVSLDYDVAKHLPEYREILSAWPATSNKRNSSMCFEQQLMDWFNFGDSQRFHRDKNFPGYCQKLHRILSRHGIEREFHLDKELDQQGKLAIWVEYLGYHYTIHDSHARVVKRQQSRFDMASKELMNAEVLKPSETTESFGYFFLLELRNDEINAEKAVASLMSYIVSVEADLAEAKAANVSIESMYELELKLAEAKARLEKDQHVLEECRKRDSHIRDYMLQVKSYEISRDEMKRQSILLPWILQQIPLTELELNKEKAASLSARDGHQKHTLKRPSVDNPSEGPSSKRRMHSSVSDSNISPATPNIVTAEKMRVLRGPKRNKHGSPNKEIVVKRQLRKPAIISNTLPSKSRGVERSHRTSRQSNANLDSTKSELSLKKTVRAAKQDRKSEATGARRAAESQILRRRTRLKRFPERYQQGSNEFY